MTCPRSLQLRSSAASLYRSRSSKMMVVRVPALLQGELASLEQLDDAGTQHVQRLHGRGLYTELCWAGEASARASP